MNKVSPIQPKLLSKINERLVLRMIQDRGPATRAEMSKMIGITFPTVAKAVSSLLDSNLLEEFDDNAARPGRPAKRLRLAREDSQVVAVSLGIAECTVATAGMDGIVHTDSVRRFPTPKNYDSLLLAITRQVKLLSADRKTLMIGVSAPALVDYKSQTAVLSANLPAINGKPIAKDLQALLGFECLLVRDSHALSLSERLFARDLPVSNIAMLNLSGGVGLGLMVEGQFLIGESGFAGELGHIPLVPDGETCHCGNRGCLETVASEWALEARLSHTLERPVKINEILDLAQNGNQLVLQELGRMEDYLAMGVAYVVNLMNPGTFYFYGRIFDRRPELLPSIVEKTKRLTIKPSFAACRFEFARGGILDGTVASVINYLTDALVPDLDGYVQTAGVGRASQAHGTPL